MSTIPDLKSPKLVTFAELRAAAFERDFQLYVENIQTATQQETAANSNLTICCEDVVREALDDVFGREDRPSITSVK